MFKTWLAILFFVVISTCLSQFRSFPPTSFRPVVFGGYNPISDPNSNPQVWNETEWAGHQIYHNTSFSFCIIQAEDQVVAGINYRIVVQYKYEENMCQVYNLTIYDRFGQKNLTSVNLLDTPCIAALL